MKSGTDLHWNERAVRIENDAEVNLMDIFQRELEYEHICPHLSSEMRILEVGCGNGFSTQRFRSLVKYVDAFDYAKNMVQRAKRGFGEINNRFVHDDVLELSRISGEYDAVLCVRVLINLRNLDEQRLAIRNLLPRVRSGGLMVLVEGFRDGFVALSEIRKKVGMSPLKPASINFYSSVGELLSAFTEDFFIEHRFHLGLYDYLTRVVYPLMVGEDNVTHNSMFCERSYALARALIAADNFEQFSRVRGFIFRRR